MKIVSFVTLILFLAGHGNTQELYQEYTTSKDTVHYGPRDNELLPTTSKGYTLFLPDKSKAPTATVLILEDGKPNLSDTSNIFQPASARGLATLYISTGIPIDLYFSERSLGY